MKKFNVFGYSTVGRMIIVKLNCKITPDWNDYMVNNFQTLSLTDNGKFGIKIEGCLTYKQFESFKTNLKLAIIDYKIFALHDERACISKSYFADLDKIG